ncbi:Uncharacterised protein [Bordetella pertussis]|nr:Uncharacterised protein [Bordetella pertussis]
MRPAPRCARAVRGNSSPAVWRYTNSTRPLQSKPSAGSSPPQL